MKVLQTIPRFTAKSSGPATCTFNLIRAMRENGDDVRLMALASGNEMKDIDGSTLDWVDFLPNDARTPLFLSENFKNALKESHYDLYHCNGLWMGANHNTCKVAREKRSKYVLSPHGMLYPNALHLNYWKKWPLLKLWFNKDIHSATCLHATCNQEAKHCRTFGYKGPIAVIPNPVVMPEYAQLATSKPLVNGRKQIGFLGRLHPIKKIEQILYALALLTKEEQDQLSLQIMGKYDDKYEQWLKDEVKRLHLEDCVEFVGFVSGEDKYSRLQKLWGLFVPSESENFGMIVPEALICGTPVYASLGTPWEELPQYHCGWWEENTPENIARIIKGIVMMRESDCLSMGKRGRELIETRYRADIVATMMSQLYHWILDGGQKPSFILD